MPKARATVEFLLDGVEHVLVIATNADALLEAGLTGAELAVAEAVLRGWSNRVIAARRRVSERTVANQLAAVYRKLGVGSRAELAHRVGGGSRPRAPGPRRAVKSSRARAR